MSLSTKKIGANFLTILVATGSINAGCSKKKETKEPTVAYIQQIKAIVDQKCVACHKSGGIGGFALETYEQVVNHGSQSLSAIESRRMPPWAAERSCRDYRGDYSLTDDEKNMFRSWVETNMVESLPESTGYLPPPLEKLALTRVDLTLQNPEPYQPQPKPDETRCFVIDWPFKSKKYITGIDVVPTDTALVHHSSIYIVPAEDREFYQNLDAKTGRKGDGYPCSATMGVGKPTARWIGGWLPGLTSFEYPLEAGMAVEAESLVILQVHYNVPNHSHNLHSPNPPKPDQTKILFKIEDNVKLLGTLVTFTNPKWMVELEMDIPAGQKNVGHEFAGRLDLIPSLIGQKFPLQGDSFEIQSINMHGHALMSAAKMKIIREDNSEECLLDVPKFQSHWQLNYLFSKPARVKKTDKVFLRCEWDNSPENQTIVDGQRLPSINVNWGDAARDEMCFGLMFVTEKSND
jgi:hypothetical protein